MQKSSLEVSTDFSIMGTAKGQKIETLIACCLELLISEIEKGEMHSR
jgi:hypothetical protein